MAKFLTGPAFGKSLKGGGKKSGKSGKAAHGYSSAYKHK